MKKSKQKLSNILGDGDLQAIGDVVGGLMDKQAAVFRTDLKDAVGASEFRIKRDLKDYIHQGVETIMNGMGNLSDRFVEKEKFEKLVEWAKIVGEKVGVKPKI